jgi:hypothetical protein
MRCGASAVSAAAQKANALLRHSANNAPAEAEVRTRNFVVRMVQYKTNALRLELDSTKAVIIPGTQLATY